LKHGKSKWNKQIFDPFKDARSADSSSVIDGCGHKGDRYCCDDNATGHGKPRRYEGDAEEQWRNNGSGQHNGTDVSMKQTTIVVESVRPGTIFPSIALPTKSSDDRSPLSRFCGSVETIAP
jgi:hypothetical protein